MVVTGCDRGRHCRLSVKCGLQAARSSQQSIRLSDDKGHATEAEPPDAEGVNDVEKNAEESVTRSRHAVGNRESSWNSKWCALGTARTVNR